MTVANEDFFGSSFPWPTKNHRLFLPPTPQEDRGKERSPTSEAVLERLWPELDYWYREGYFQAGKVLPEHSQTHDGRVLFYPMVYCFRHYIELALKRLIQLYSATANQNVESKLRTEHAPMALWNEAARLIRRVMRPQDDSHGTLKSVERCMNELNQIDRSSQLFRYPENTQGDSASNQLPLVDIDQFVATMDNLHAFFGGYEEQGEELLQYKREMQADCRGG